MEDKPYRPRTNAVVRGASGAAKPVLLALCWIGGWALLLGSLGDKNMPWSTKAALVGTMLILITKKEDR